MLKKIFFAGFVSILFVSAGLAQGGSTKGSSDAKASTETTVKSAAFRPTKDQVMQGQKFLKEQKLYNGEATGVYNNETRAAIKSYQKANGLAITGNFNSATLGKMNIAFTDKQKAAATGIVMPVESTAGTTGAVTPTDSNAGKTGAVSPIDSKAGKTGVVTPTDSKAGKTGAVTPTDSTTAKRPAPFRANDDQIKAAQKILRDGKMLNGGEDGKLDDLTRAGLGAFQEAKGMKVTKTLNAATLDKMGIPLTDKQKEQVAAQAAFDAAKAGAKDQ